MFSVPRYSIDNLYYADDNVFREPINRTNLLIVQSTKEKGIFYVN